MKRLLFLLMAAVLTLSSCSNAEKQQDANSCAKLLAENEKLLLSCVTEMEQFEKDRIYAAMEPKDGGADRLVSYEKESDDRTEIENDVLENALKECGFRLIFFQTASDSRRCVIFSFAKEKDDGTVCGIYYSYDALPCAWWGRKAELVKKDGRYLQIDRSGNASYFTLPLSEHFYYFEKFGDLIA